MKKSSIYPHYKSDAGKLSIEAACDERGCIGHRGSLPWHFPQDLANYKRITNKIVLIMGRRTFESMQKKCSAFQDNKYNIVLSRSHYDPKEFRYSPGRSPQGRVMDDLKNALRFARFLLSCSYTGIFIIGGESIFEQALPLADRLYLTKIKSTFEGDSFFPRVNVNEWMNIRSATEVQEIKGKGDVEVISSVFERTQKAGKRGIFHINQLC